MSSQGGSTATEAGHGGSRCAFKDWRPLRLHTIREKERHRPEPVLENHHDHGVILKISPGNPGGADFPFILPAHP